MILWLASYPRSGNTFLRMILHRGLGVRSAVVYDIDGVAARLGEDAVGFRERAGSLDELRDDADLHVVKTHRQRDADVDEADRAICLVRDGRDALVSFARLRSEQRGTAYEDELRALIRRDGDIGTGSWGRNVLGWLRPPAPHRRVLRYEDLVAAPRSTLGPVLGELVPEWPALDGAALPAFADLRALDGGFFRRGIAGSHRDEMPDDLQRLFWARPGNAEAMALLGYGRSTDGSSHT